MRNYGQRLELSAWPCRFLSETIQIIILYKRQLRQEYIQNMTQSDTRAKRSRKVYTDAKVSSAVAISCTGKAKARNKRDPFKAELFTIVVAGSDYAGRIATSPCQRARTRYWRVYTSVCLASVKCLCAWGHNTMITPGLEPGPHGPEIGCNPLNHRVPLYIKYAKEKQLNFPTTKKIPPTSFIAEIKSFSSVRWVSHEQQTY